MNEDNDVQLSPMRPQTRVSILDPPMFHDSALRSASDPRKTMTSLRTLIQEGMGSQLKQTIEQGDLDVIHLLNNDDENLLHIAIQCGQDEIASDLIDIVT